MRQAPAPVIRLHDLRHLHASHMLAAGVQVTVVSQRLGHAQVGMTLHISTHVLPAVDADAVEHFACHLYGHDPTPEPRPADDTPPPGRCPSGLTRRSTAAGPPAA